MLRGSTFTPETDNILLTYNAIPIRTQYYCSHLRFKAHGAIVSTLHH